MPWGRERWKFWMKNITMQPHCRLKHKLCYKAGTSYTTFVVKNRHNRITVICYNTDHTMVPKMCVKMRFQCIYKIILRWDMFWCWVWDEIWWVWDQFEISLSLIWDEFEIISWVWDGDYEQWLRQDLKIKIKLWFHGEYLRFHYIYIHGLCKYYHCCQNYIQISISN